MTNSPSPTGRREAERVYRDLDSRSQMWATRMREAGDDIMRQRAECWCMALAYAASVVKVALVDGFLPNPHTEESK